MADIEKVLAKTKVSVLMNEKLVFFATVLFSLKQRITDETQTAATDGTSLLINPDFFLSLSPMERDFLLMHETYHVVLMHMLRLNGRDHQVWNMACDYVINADLIKLGMTMPKGGLYDKKYEGMGADEVYNILMAQPENKRPKPHMADLVQPGSGGGTAAGTDSKPIDAAVEQQIKDIIMRAEAQAAMSGKNAGYIPASVKRLIENMKTPRLPWNSLLRRFLFSYDKTEYTYRKPNRRYSPEIMPTRHGEALDHVAVVIDVSGSVQQYQFEHFVSETHALIKKMRPKKVTVIQFNTRVVSVDTAFTVDDLMKIEFKGGGGTRIQGVYDWVSEHKPKITLAFTDGCFPHGDRHDRSNWVWIINENPRLVMPFGRTIHFDPPTE